MNQQSDLINSQNNPSEPLLSQNPSELPENPNNEQISNQQEPYIPPPENNENDPQSPEDNDQRATLIARISSIESKLDHGWYKCFGYWLYVSMVFTAILVTGQGLIYIKNLIKYGLYSWTLVPLVGLFVAGIWNFATCWTELQAIYRLSLKKAEQAFSMIKGFLVFYAVMLIFVFFFEIPSFGIIFHIYNMNGFFVLFLAMNLMVIGITFHGAFKVRNKLFKRASLRLGLSQNPQSNLNNA